MGRQPGHAGCVPGRHRRQGRDPEPAATWWMASPDVCRGEGASQRGCYQHALIRPSDGHLGLCRGRIGGLPEGPGTGGRAEGPSGRRAVRQAVVRRAGWHPTGHTAACGPPVGKERVQQRIELADRSGVRFPQAHGHVQLQREEHSHGCGTDRSPRERDNGQSRDGSCFYAGMPPPFEKCPATSRQHALEGR